MNTIKVFFGILTKPKLLLLTARFLKSQSLLKITKSLYVGSVCIFLEALIIKTISLPSSFFIMVFSVSLFLMDKLKFISRAILYGLLN